MLIAAAQQCKSGGGFLLVGEEFWDQIRLFIPRVRLFFSLSFKVEISSSTLIPFFMPEIVQSGSAR